MGVPHRHSKIPMAHWVEPAFFFSAIQVLMHLWSALSHRELRDILVDLLPGQPTPASGRVGEARGSEVGRSRALRTWEPYAARPQPGFPYLVQMPV